MTKKRKIIGTARLVKKLSAHRLPVIFRKVFDGLRKHGSAIRPEDYENMSDSLWIDLATATMVKKLLKQELSPNQVNSCWDSALVYSLFLQYCRAEEGVEGYGFTTTDKKTRFVYGTPLEGENSLISETG